jgi:predicted MFS family arabinose efflux permease
VSGISACAWVAFTVLFASYYPRGHTTRAMGYITFCNTLSVMAATAVGGRMADLYGWTAPFWASAAVSVVGLAAVAFVHEPKAARPAAQPLLDRFRSVIRYRELVLASSVAALGQYTNFATNFGFVTNYAVTIGASKTELGLLAMVSTLAGSVATLLSGSVFAPHLGVRKSVVGGYLAMTVAVAAIPYVMHVEGLYLSQIIAGFGRGSAYPILMGLAIARLPDSDKATAMGFFQAVYAIGMSAGPIGAGLIGAEWGYTSLFLSSAGVGLVTALVALGLPGKGKAMGG